MSKTMTCPVCGEQSLSTTSGPGRTVKHRTMLVEVPADFALPECSACGARPLDWRTAARLDPLLEAAYQSKLRQMVEADLAVLSAARPLYEWERLLGLSAGSLSRLRNDNKTPSAPLVALVRLLANDPDRRAELEALWAGRPASVVVAERPRLRFSAQTLPPARSPLPLVERGEWTQSWKAA
jgi:hypothetical protein